MKFALYTMILFGFIACSKEKKLGEDWSATPLVKKTVTLTEEKQEVKVTLDFPKEMKLEKEYATPDRKRWIADRSDYFSEPGFTLSIRKKTFKDLKHAKSSGYFDSKMVMAQEKDLGNGRFLFVFHTKNKGLLYVRTYSNYKDMVIECQGSQAKTGGVPNFAATTAWLQKVCTSLTFK